MYDNKPDETKYIYRDFDSKGQQLLGKNNYTVTFPKGQLPPVKGFWSVTLYDMDTRCLVQTKEQSPDHVGYRNESDMIIS
jgi:hypothetical protein